MKSVFEHQYLQMFGFKLNKYVYFHALEVVGRSTSETQFQVG